MVINDIKVINNEKVIAKNISYVKIFSFKINSIYLQLPLEWPH